jgi:MoaA/NifB/PqqE/SkfB family radical SAM enzyme
LINPVSRNNPWGIRHSVSNEVNTEDDKLVKYAEFNITGRCQGGCVSCPTITSYPDEKTKKTLVDLEEEYENFKEIILKLKDLGLEFLTIYGREPTLWDSESGKETGEDNFFLRKLITWVSKDLGIRVCLGTSGLHLNKPVLKTLFDYRGILFMKNWGSQSAVEKLMRAKNAYSRMNEAWKMVGEVRKEYKKTTVVAEFLYTEHNRNDLTGFWKWAHDNAILPQLEVPVIVGDCVKSFDSLKVDMPDYVRDIYSLSIQNLALKLGISLDEAKESELWEPPFGSKFPMACDRLTKTNSVFIERNGNMSVCSGVPISIGNINDKDIQEKLRKNELLTNIRNSYQNLGGACRDCYYSKEAKLCYGCRGNALSYLKENDDVLGEDPMCFGVTAARLEPKILKEFVSQVHINKILDYFNSNPVGCEHEFNIKR